MTFDLKRWFPGVGRSVKEASQASRASPMVPGCGQVTGYSFPFPVILTIGSQIIERDLPLFSFLPILYHFLCIWFIQMRDVIWYLSMCFWFHSILYFPSTSIVLQMSQVPDYCPDGLQRWFLGVDVDSKPHNLQWRFLDNYRSLGTESWFPWVSEMVPRCGWVVTADFKFLQSSARVPWWLQVTGHSLPVPMVLRDGSRYFSLAQVYNHLVSGYVYMLQLLSFFKNLLLLPSPALCFSGSPISFSMPVIICLSSCYSI